MKEYQIGEQFQCENKTLQCVKIAEPVCDGCFFTELCYHEEFISGVTELVGDCSDSFRKDGKNVVFKLVENNNNQV